MKNSDMNIIEFNENGNAVEISDRYSFGHHFPDLDINLGGQNDLNNRNFNFNSNGELMASYQRKWETGDKWDAVLKPGESQPIILAWGPGKLAFHVMNYSDTEIKLPNSD
jgi:hypothetical protein